MSDYLEKHCPELVKQIEGASAAGAEIGSVWNAEAQRQRAEAMQAQIQESWREQLAMWRPQYVSRDLAMSCIDDQRNRMLSMRTALDKQEEVLTKQEKWIHFLYWLSGIGWGLAVGFGVLWGAK